jgi:hypothetical protein
MMEKLTQSECRVTEERPCLEQVEALFKKSKEYAERLNE